MFILVSFLFTFIWSAFTLDVDDEFNHQIEQMSDSELDEMMIILSTKAVPPDKHRFKFLERYFEKEEINNLKEKNKNVLSLEDIIDSCAIMDVKECLELVFETVVDQLNNRSFQLIVCMMFDVVYVVFLKTSECTIFRKFTAFGKDQTKEFIIYRVGKRRVKIYKIMKMLSIMWKITLVYYLLEYLLVLVFQIFISVAYVIWFGWFWSFYDYMYKKQGNYKKKKKAYLNKRKLSSAVPEVGTTYYSDLYEKNLNRIFDSNDCSKDLISVMVNTVFGSLYEYGLHYKIWRRSNGNRSFNVNNRHVNYEEWSWIRKKMINIEKDRSILIKWKEYSNEEIIQAVMELIVVCAEYSNNNKRGIVCKMYERGNVINKIVQKSESKVETLLYNYHNNVMLRRVIYQVSEQIYDVIHLSESCKQVQCYNKNLQRSDCLAKKITGTMKVKSDDSEVLIAKLLKIDNTFNYVMDNTVLEHPFSHAISKVKHMHLINNNLVLRSNEKILDVGSSLCDIELGNGVVYNIAEVEEQDQKRIEEVLNRIENYLQLKSNINITLYCGDITEFDLKDTNITKLLLHNCCYNIDMVKLFDVCNNSGITSVINSAQIPLNALHGFDSDSMDNEMLWTFKVNKNSSTLGTSDYNIIGSTNVDSYEHKFSVMYEWFKACSLKMNYLNKNIIWNSITESATEGYFVAKWNVSNVMKKSGMLSSNDEYFDMVSVSEDSTYITLLPTTRNRRMNMVSNTFMIPSQHKNRENREHVITVMLNNRCKAKTQYINVQTDGQWKCLSDIRQEEVVVYRQNTVNLEQIPFEVQCQYELVTEREINHILTEIKPECFEVISAIESNDLDLLQDILNKSNEIVTFKVEDTYIALSTNKTTKTCGNTIVITKEGGMIIGKFEVGKEILFYDLDQLMNLIYQNSLNENVEDLVLEQIKGKQIISIMQDIVVRRISKIKVLTEYDQRIDTDTQQANHAIEVKSKVFVVPTTKDSSVEDVQEAVATGVLKYDFVNSIVSINLKNGKINDPFNLIRINGNKLDISYNVVVNYLKYDNNVTRSNRIRMIYDQINPVLKITDVNGVVRYTRNVSFIGKLSRKDGFVKEYDMQAFF